MSAPLSPRTPFFQRLPEIYRIRDAEQFPPDQLKAYLGVYENAFSALHENIEALYHDLFIDTCDDWVVPYLADLLGTTHLKGEPRTIRADVADTIALRRRKGTLGVIERLAANLTDWASHAVELRENLAWTQHLNHQRPDVGGRPPHAYSRLTRFYVPRGGTVPVRDPAMLSLIGSPFSPFAHTVDVKPANTNEPRYNLPNLAIFLWRLATYRVRVTRPVFRNPLPLAGIPPRPGDPTPTPAAFGARFDFHPLGRPVRLFNLFRSDPRADAAHLTTVDEVPGPIPDSRLTTPPEASFVTLTTDAPNPDLDSRQWTGNPAAYVNVDRYTPGTPPVGLDLGDAGLQLYVPDNNFPAATAWTFRGDNLCAWESGLRRSLQNREIVIDPDIGRVLIGVNTLLELQALQLNLLVGYSYAAVGKLGAQATDHGASPATVSAEPDPSAIPAVRIVNGFLNPNALRDALADARTWTVPTVLEIQDSLVHPLDLNDAALATTTRVENGQRHLLLGRSLVIRAAGSHRPIIQLARPLRLRPRRVRADDALDPFNPGNPADASGQPQVDAAVRNLLVRFEGVMVTAATGAGFAVGDALVARAAVARLEIIDATFDPGGWRDRQTIPAPVRAPLRAALQLAEPYGFADPLDEDAFQPTPDVVIQRAITGAVQLDEGYALVIEDSIVDAGRGPGEDSTGLFALTAATNPAGAFSAPLVVKNATFFGRVRATSARGQGGIWTQRLVVLDHQKGCIKYSYFSGDGDVLPQNYACVDATEATLAFTSTWFADPGYGQLSRTSDERILARGPRDDAMGATNFLLESHKWTNLQIRLREFMPLGVRPVVVAVT